MNIIISGGKSRFSRELQNQSSNHTLIPLSKEEMDITDIESIYEKDIESRMEAKKVVKSIS